MGPHPERCGYRRAGCRPEPSGYRFNGATPRKVWIRGSWRRSGRSWRRFNGATPRKVWIRPAELLDRAADLLASMGPHPERCGYQDEPQLPDLRHPASMGPHPERCGYHMARQVTGSFGSLQWGHTPKGVDTPNSTRSSMTFAVASMGPHPERCGYLHRRPQAAPGCGASMGPHPERCGYALLESEGLLRIELQWGHTPKGVDTRSTCRPSRSADHGFNGATPRKVWIRGWGCSHDHRPDASMGPHPERC